MDDDVFQSILGDKTIIDEIKNLRKMPTGEMGFGRSGTTAEAVRSAAERLSSNGPLFESLRGDGIQPRGESLASNLSQPEAIVLLMGRPPLLVQDNRIAVPELDEWRARLNPYRSVLETRLKSVGRVELRRHFHYPWAGTGWMVDENILVTNRHVAEIFAAGYGKDVAFRKNGFGETILVKIDFRQEHQRMAAAECEAAEILWVEDADGPDMAFIKLSRSPDLPAPLPLSTRLPRKGEGYIGVIGYPARDPGRNDPGEMDRIFGDVYEKKRFSPGQVIYQTEDNRHFSHDCTTLGGSSGSAIIDFETGNAVGLHYAGKYLKDNRAITSMVLLERLADFSKVVAVTSVESLIGSEPGTLGELTERRRRQAPDANDVGRYVGRVGFQRDFITGLPDIEPPLLTAKLERSAAPVIESGYELKYTHFSVWMNAKRRLAYLTAVNIDGRRLIRYPRSSDKWYTDPRIEDLHQVGNELYEGNRLDRGHLVRRLDPVWGDDDEARQAMEDTFHYTNAAPQHEDLNQVTWNQLEDYLLDNAEAHEFRINVFTGPVFRPRDRVYRDVSLPQEFWKVVVMGRKDADGALVPHATAYVLSQSDMLTDIEFAFGAFKTYQVSVARIETMTGLNLSHLVDYDPLASSDEETLPIKSVPLEGWWDIVLDRRSRKSASTGVGAATTSAS